MRVFHWVTSFFWRLCPLTVFMACASTSQLSGDGRWLSAFLYGGLAAFVHLMIIVVRGRIVNRIILAVDLWLLLGCLAVFVPLDSMLLLFRQTKEAGLFAVICAVGCVSTVVGPHGFIGCVAPARRILRYSLVLLLLAFFCCALSLGFQGRIVLSAALPLLILLLANSCLRKRAEYGTAL